MTFITVQRFSYLTFEMGKRSICLPNMKSAAKFAYDTIYKVGSCETKVLDIVVLWLKLPS